MSNSSSVMSSREWSRITDTKSKSTRSRSTDRTRPNRVTLCSCLQSHPAAFDGSGLKLSLVSSNICEIDKVPGQLVSKVQTLYLSNNHIISLSGVEQFASLRSLSVANNLIRYLSSLRSLASIEQLERVSLEGNVVTNMPFYRQYLVGLCPRLLSLDGINVTTEERIGARSSSRQLTAFYDQLRLNELQNIILKNVCLQLNLHADFNHVVLGRFRSLRSENIPSTRDVRLSVEAGRGRGVGFLLGQCLSGGVFRWLMLACGEDIDKAIQDIAYRTHLSLLSRMGGKDKVHVLKDPRANAAHWESTVGECLKYQQQLRLHLVAECMRDRGDGSAKGLAGDIMSVLQQLEFEASALHNAALQASASNLGGGGGGDAVNWLREHRMSYCGMGPHASNSSDLPSSRKSSVRVSFSADNIRDDRENRENRENMRENSRDNARDNGYTERHRNRPEGSPSRPQTRPDRGSPTRSPSRDSGRDMGYNSNNSATLSSDRKWGSPQRKVSPSPLPPPSDDIGDEVQARYIMLLRQMETQGKGQQGRGQQTQGHGQLVEGQRERQGYGRGWREGYGQGRRDGSDQGEGSGESKEFNRSIDGPLRPHTAQSSHISHTTQARTFQAGAHKSQQKRSSVSPSSRRTSVSPSARPRLSPFLPAQQLEPLGSQLDRHSIDRFSPGHSPTHSSTHSPTILSTHPSGYTSTHPQTLSPTHPFGLSSTLPTQSPSGSPVNGSVFSSAQALKAASPEIPYEKLAGVLLRSKVVLEGVDIWMGEEENAWGADTSGMEVTVDIRGDMTGGGTMGGRGVDRGVDSGGDRGDVYADNAANGEGASILGMNMSMNNSNNVDISMLSEQEKSIREESLGPPPSPAIQKRAAERSLNISRDSTGVSLSSPGAGGGGVGGGGSGVGVGNVGGVGGKSMKVMKKEVDQALQDLAFMRRSEVLSWEANDALRMAAKSAKKEAISLCDKGLARLLVYRNKVIELKADTIAASQWTGFVQSILDEIEVEKSKIEETKGIETEAQQHEERCIEAVSEEEGRREALIESSAEVASALEAIDREIQTEGINTNTSHSSDPWDPWGHGDRSYPSDGISHPTQPVHSIENIVTAFKNKCLSVKRLMLRRLRLRVRRQRRIKAFYKKNQNRIRIRLMIDVVQSWRKHIDVIKRGRMLFKWTTKNRLLTTAFNNWKEEEESEVQGRQIGYYHLRTRALACLRSLRFAVIGAKRKAIKLQKRKGSLLCFFVKRIFRAWRLLSVSSRLDPLHEAVSTVRATQFKKNRVFQAWLDVTLESKEELNIVSGGIMKRKGLEIMQIQLSEWYQTMQTCKYARVSACKKVFLRLSFFAYQTRRGHRNIQLAALRAGSCKVRMVIRFLRSLVRRRRLLKRADSTVSHRREVNLSVKYFNNWVGIVNSYAEARIVAAPSCIVWDSDVTSPYLENSLLRTSQEWDKFVPPAPPTPPGLETLGKLPLEKSENSENSRNKGSTVNLGDGGKTGNASKMGKIGKMGEMGMKGEIQNTTLTSLFSSIDAMDGRELGRGDNRGDRRGSLEGDKRGSLIWSGDRSVRDWERGQVGGKVRGHGRESWIEIDSRDVSDEVIQDVMKDVMRRGSVVERMEVMRIQKQRQSDLTLPDEEAEGEEDYHDIHASRRNIRATYRALKKWHHRTLRILRLKTKKSLVQTNRNIRLLRNTFTAAATLWVRSARKRIREMRLLQKTSAEMNSITGGGGAGGMTRVGGDRSRDGNPPKSRHETLQLELGDITIGAARLSTNVDNCSALLLEAVTRCGEVTQDIADTQASITLLKKEKEKVVRETTRLRNESQAIHVLSLSLSNSDYWMPSKPDYDSSMLVDSDKENATTNNNEVSLSVDKNDVSRSSNRNVSFSSISKNQNNENNKNNDKRGKDENEKDEISKKGEKGEKDMHDTAIDERVSLMQHMEQLYQHAVLTQSASAREQVTLKARANDAAIECARGKLTLAELDEKIVDLKDSRKFYEESLRKYTNSREIKDIQSKMIATADYHESALRDMESDKKHLILLMENAVASESALKEEIDAMRDAILQHHRQKIMRSSQSNPSQLAYIALKGTDLRGQSTASLSSITSLMGQRKLNDAQNVLRTSQERKSFK